MKPTTEGVAMTETKPSTWFRKTVTGGVSPHALTRFVWSFASMAGLLPALAGGAMAQVAPERKSLVPNGSFEEGVGEFPPPGWVIWGSNEDMLPERFVYDPENPFEGNYSLRIEHPANTHAFPVTDPKFAIQTKPGKAYIITFAARTAHLKEDGVFYLESYESISPMKGAPLAGRFPIPASIEWKQYSFQISDGENFRADETSYILLAFRPTRGKGAEQTMWIDSIVVSEVDSAAGGLIDERKLDRPALNHRLEPGKSLLVTVDLTAPTRPAIQQAGGVSFHRIGGGGRHIYDYEGNLVMEPELIEAVRQMRLPMTRFYGVGDHSFSVNEAIDKIAHVCEVAKIPQEWTVLELEPVSAGETYSPQFWADAVSYSMEKGYKFRFWEVANEPYTRKATAFEGPGDYAEHVKAVSAAVKAVQSDAKVGIGIHAGTTGWGNYLLKAAAGSYDFVVAHWYDGANPDRIGFEAAILGSNFKRLDEALTLNALIEAYNPGREVYQLDTEWGLAPEGVREDDREGMWVGSNITGSVYRAVRMIYYAREGMVRGASGWEMFSRSHYELFAFLTREAPEKRYVLYWTYYYFNRHCGPKALDISGTAPFFNAGKYDPAKPVINANSPNDYAGPLTPVLATASDDGSEVYLVIANGSWEQDIPAEFTLTGITPASVKGVVLSQDDMKANPLVDKREDVVSDLAVTTDGEKLAFTVPVHSVVFVTVSTGVREL
jgi:hypothetical protein